MSGTVVPFKPQPEGLGLLLDLDAARDPFLVECVAVDVTSALRGAEVGLRAMRQRPVLRRVWESVTGDANRRTAAIGSDLVAVQRATLHLVGDIFANETRTWTCMERVLANLHAVNRDLDDVTAVAADLRNAITLVQTTVSELEVRVSKLREDLDREGSLRRARDQYLAGSLHAGFGPLLRGALYVAHVRAHFGAGEDALRDEELHTALGVVTAQLGGGPQPVSEMLTAELQVVAHEALEKLVYVTTRRPSAVVSVLASGGRRLLAELAVDERSVREAIAVTSVFEDPTEYLSRNIRRPAALVERLAEELEQ